MLGLRAQFIVRRRAEQSTQANYHNNNHIVAFNMRLELFLLASLGCLCHASDYFSSITGLEQLLHTEHTLMRDLSSQLSETRIILQQLEK